MGPGRRKTSRIPDSEIQWVSVDFCVGWATSIQVSDATATKTATVESVECAWIKGIAPYNGMVEEARYSKTSAL